MLSRPIHPLLDSHLHSPSNASSPGRQSCCPSAALPSPPSPPSPPEYGKLQALAPRSRTDPPHGRPCPQLPSSWHGCMARAEKRLKGQAFVVSHVACRMLIAGPRLAVGPGPFLSEIDEHLGQGQCQVSGGRMAYQLHARATSRTGSGCVSLLMRPTSLHMARAPFVRVNDSRAGRRMNRMGPPESPCADGRGRDGPSPTTHI